MEKKLLTLLLVCSFWAVPALVLGEDLMPVPDLKIAAENITVTPSVLKGGSSATFKVKVKNLGLFSASGVKVRFLLADAQIGEKTISTISKNSSGYATLVYTLPSDAVGVKTLKIIADPLNTISEVDETNNEATKEITIVANLPDLAVAAADLTVAPAAPKAGDKIAVKAVIKNIGVAAAKNVKVKFFLGETLITEKNIAFISANAKNIPSITYTLPANLAGEQTLKVIVDAPGAIAELDENNNSAEAKFSVEPANIDLSVVAEDITFSNSSPKAGTSVKISAALKNSGNTGAKNVIAQILVNGAKTLEKKNLTIKKSGQSVISTNYKVPAAALEALTVTVKIDPDNAIAEKDENNNTAGKTLTLNPLNRDLALKSGDWAVTPTTPIVAGRKFTVKGKVSNVGLDKAEATKLTISLVKYEDNKKVVEDKLAIINRLKKNIVMLKDLLIAREKESEKDQVAGLGEKKRVLASLGTISVPSLGSGKSTVVSKVVTLPGDYAYESAEIEITANADNKIYEFNRANNILVLKIDTRPKSFDAGIASEDLSHTPANKIIKAGESVVSKGKVSNQGTEKISNLTVKFYANIKPSLEGATLLATKTITALPEGKSRRFAQNLKIPASATQNQVVVVSLDPDNKINESNEANNVAYHTVPITPQTRDLAVEILRGSPVNPKVGQTVNWKITVKNFGNTKAENVVLALFTDISSGQPAQTVTIASIDSKQTAERRLSWTVPSNLAYAINYPVRAVADYGNNINEPNEENNDKIYLLSLKAPDLSIVPNEVSFSPQVGIYKGESFRIQGFARNNNVFLVSSAKLGLYYFVVGANNNLIKLTDIDLGALAKGQTKEFYLISRLPDSVTLGANVGIVAAVDSDNQTLESDESNNSATVFKTVVEPPRRLQGELLGVEVEDEQWEDLNGVTVVLVNNATGVSQTKVTGVEDFYYSGGRVIFENMPLDLTSYTLTISAPGFRTITKTFTYDREDYQTYDQRYSLDKKAIISGRVTSNTAGLAGVTVNIVDTGIGTVSDSNGNYQFTLAGGNYQLKFTKDGYSRIIENANLAPVQTLTLDKTMSAAPAGYFEGIITNDDGNPMSGVEIKSGDTTIAYTDSNGKFSISASGNKTYKFRAAGYTGIDMPAQDYAAGHEYIVNLQMFKPSTASQTERGATFVSWHQNVGTPANAFFIPEYNVDVWWGIGKIKTTLDYSQNDSGTKLQKLTVRLTGDKWECHKVSGSGDIETSAINIPITIAAGGCDNWLTKITVAKVAIISGGEEVWSDSSYWASTQDPMNAATKVFTLDNLAVNWDNDFKVKVWFRVEKKSGVSNEGEGAGALTGYNLDKKLVTWRPAKPPTANISTSWAQVGNYLVGLLDANPLQIAYNAVANFTDLFTVQEYDQWQMDEVLSGDYPGAPPAD